MPDTLILTAPYVKPQLCKTVLQEKSVTLINTNIASAVNTKLVHRLKMKNEGFCCFHRFRDFYSWGSGITEYQGTGHRVNKRKVLGGRRTPHPFVFTVTIMY